ncbi:hypothetical protein LTR95_011600 [Oleoguttula sp. CCFEE 5521]
MLKLIVLAVFVYLNDASYARVEQITLTESFANYPGYSVHFPSSPPFADAQSAYWSLQQSILKPGCRFTPHGVQDVQLAINHLILTNTSFAIASGGHSSNTGASNINAGVTVDLSRLDEVTIADEGNAVWLGPGARWSDVYAKLEESGLAVSGGRVGHVGVGGYVLGGGFSWFANELAWTCDQVLEYEIVTPARQILKVSATENEDLFWALKGSLGAFGVVTRIKMPTARIATVFGGALTYRQENVVEVFAALQALTMKAREDLHSQAYISFGWVQRCKRHVTSAYLMNTAGDRSSAALAKLTSIPHVASSLRNTTLGESAREITDSNPLGFRRTKFTLTASSTVEATQIVHDAYLRTSASTRFGLDDMLGVTIQPLTLPHLRKGRNIFSLRGEKSPLLLLSAEFWWSDRAYDQMYEEAARALHDAWVTELQAKGLLHSWLYPNYAASWQRPFKEPSIPRGAQEALKSVRRKHDPDDIWRQLVPGIWHV